MLKMNTAYSVFIFGRQANQLTVGLAAEDISFALDLLINIRNMMGHSAAEHFIHLEAKGLHIQNNRIAVLPIRMDVDVTVLSRFLSDK